MMNCPDCGAAPQTTHTPGCNVERCSSCGGQRLTCDCEKHSPWEARWPGEGPFHAEVDPAQPAWAQEGGFVRFPVGDPIKLENVTISTPYPQFYLTPLPSPPPEEEIIRHTGSFNVMTHWYEYTIKLSLEAFRRIPDRRAFRQILGERLQAVYQEALVEWEGIHGEGEE